MQIKKDIKLNDTKNCYGCPFHFCELGYHERVVNRRCALGYKIADDYVINPKRPQKCIEENGE
jgi:hypothetical protein